MKWRQARSIGSCLLAASLGGLLAPLAGCSGTVRYVDIDSKPTGAAVYVNGERRGVTRDEKVRIDFTDPTSRVLIQVVKPRYKPAFQYWKIDEVPAKKVFYLEVD
jgi:hypothetical protein